MPQGARVKYVLLYESADDVMAKAPLHYDAHVAWAGEFEARGELLGIGTFEDPQTQGSMAMFRTREAAEAFVTGDPFIANGVVKSHDIRGWNG
jgi:uncharacterized protein YciI